MTAACWRNRPRAPPAKKPDARVSPLGNAGAALLGTVGPVPADRRAELEAMGVPPQGPVGLSGLELALDDRLRGTARRQLMAGEPGAGLGRAASRAGGAHEHLPRAAADPVAALGAQYGGIVADAPARGRSWRSPASGSKAFSPRGPPSRW